MGLSNTKTKFDNGTTTSNGIKNINWSFLPEAGTFLTNNLQLGAGTKTTTGTTTSDGPKTNNFGINLNAGFGYALSKKVTAVGSFGFIGYNSSTQKSGTSKTRTSNFGLGAQSLGNRFNIGFYYTL